MGQPYMSGITQHSLLAGADLSAKQFYAVNCNSSGAAILAGAGATFVGILANKPESGEEAAIITAGICPLVLGGTVAAGDAVKIDSNGKGVAASSTNSAIGRCLVGGASGEQGVILLQPHVVA